MIALLMFCQITGMRCEIRSVISSMDECLRISRAVDTAATMGFPGPPMPKLDGQLTKFYCVEIPKK